MPNHNAAPPVAEAGTHKRRTEIVQFNDGQMALLYSMPGDRETLGNDSQQKWARSFNSPNSVDMALIKTRSGNVYGIARGIVLNRDGRSAHKLQPDPFEVAIGEPCTIPGVTTTTQVAKLWLRYKTTDPGSDMADRQIDAPSPFTALEADVTRIIDAHLQSNEATNTAHLDANLPGYRQAATVITNEEVAPRLGKGVPILAPAGVKVLGHMETTPINLATRNQDVASLK